ncbi:MAG: hypothetical protein HQL23_08400, partial [Candidatus Omnitrophica bacterium]|nr:hypothetical protein [Candidatus Omnitrophota bacterium]
MFQWRNNVQKQGQVAVIMILVIAAALVLYAAVLNLGKTSRVKTLTTLAANQAAALMASQYASYTHKLYFEQLDSRLSYCKTTSLIKAFIMLTVAVGLSFIPGVGPFIAALSIALMAANFVLQAVVVQPMITSRWNQALSAAMPDLANQFLEQGIQKGLSVAVTEQEKVPDLYDMDTNRKWGWKDANHSLPADWVSRFAFYYDRRLSEIKVRDDSVINHFLMDANGLTGFTMPNVTGGLLLWSPGCGFGALNAECNVCCQPAASEVAEELQKAKIFRPASCTAAEIAACSNPALSPYTDAGPIEAQGKSFPDVYDQNFEDPLQAIGFITGAATTVSFLSQLGRDDPNQYYRKDYTNPATFPLPNTAGFHAIAPPNYWHAPVRQLPNSDPQHRPKFQIEDATGIFPFFYEIRQNTDPTVSGDYGVEWTTTPKDTPLQNCLWKEGACVFTDDTIPYDVRAGRQLNLSANPEYAAAVGAVGGTVNLLANARFNKAAQVDGIADTIPLAGGQIIPLASDAITVPVFAAGGIGAGTFSLIAANDQCAETTFRTNSPDITIGFWKPGADRVCNIILPPDSPEHRAWPYGDYCPKQYKDPSAYPNGAMCVEPGQPIIDENGSPTGATGDMNRSCQCEETPDPRFWPDDVLDDLITRVPEFVQLAYAIINQENPQQNFETWYEQIAPWIEPAISTAADKYNIWAAGPGTGVCNNAASSMGLCCYKCEVNSEGVLWKWYRWIQGMRERLQMWQQQDYSHAAAWCVPLAGNPKFDPAILGANPTRAEENLTFTAAAGPGLPVGRGNMAAVIQCLNWNVYGDPVYKGPPMDESKFSSWPNVLTVLKDNKWVAPITGSTTTFGVLRDVTEPGDEIALRDALSHASYANPAADAIVLALKQNQIGNTAQFQACAAECQGLQGKAAPFALTQCSALPRSLVPGFDELPMDANSCANAPNPARDPAQVAAWDWGTQLDQSWQEAKVQREKFKQRLFFLQKMNAELNRIVGILQNAEDHFAVFLNGLSQDLIKRRLQVQNNTGEAGLPGQAIYAWQSAPSDDGRPGPWHAVRVDARGPLRCGACNYDETTNTSTCLTDTCNATQDGFTPLPWVHT